MRIETLKLKDFRNYDLTELKFDGSVNILLGQNAQGKTNMLESVYFCAVGKSFRTFKERELIKTNADKAYIKTVTQKKAGSDSIEVLIDSREKKRIAINELPITRMGELMGVCAVVLFSPDELKIVKESPENRRRFVNIALSQMSKNYFYLLMRYNKVLTSRNKLLKSQKASDDDLYVWNKMLIQSGAKIIKHRRDFIKSLNVPCGEFCKRLGGESIVIEYEGIDGEDIEEISDNFLKELQDSKTSDLKYGYTHAGAHKDDLKILLNGIDVRVYGSQGQQRTAALALKLAEAEIIKNKLGEYPILLLDDVMSELDLSRQKALVSMIEHTQSIITSTDAQNFNNANIIQIKSGRVI